MSADDLLYDDPALAGFYDLENHWGEDFDLIRAMTRPGLRVLDLGCGTGLLGAGLALAGCIVTGVDPAAAMLDIARRRAGGDGVSWRAGDARAIRLGRTFDLVVLTGHAFQVFLTEDERRAVLATIAAHLAQGGRFIFDSRNPLREEWREWTPEASRREIVHPDFGRVRAWNDVARDDATGIVTYETVYEVEATGRRHGARSRLSFPGRGELERLIAGAGLIVDRWLGNWSGAPAGPDAPELIPIGRLGPVHAEP